MNIWKRLYELAPYRAQRLAVEAVSGRNYRRRYGSVFESTRASIGTHERLGREELAGIQMENVLRVLSFAKAHVPYYQSLDLSVTDLGTWPVVSKADVQAEPGRFQSHRAREKGTVLLKTSGTTGAPLGVRCSSAGLQAEMAFRWQHKSWAGISFGARGAFIAGHPVIPPGRRKPPFWVVDRVENRLLLSSYHISADTAHHYLRALELFEPVFIHGYPSAIHLLSLANLDNRFRVRPRAVFTASETLLSMQRASIERAFGAKVFNWYGQTELTCNIVQCDFGELHIRTDYGLLEVLDDGSMVCTGFNNDAMPFIRYRTGDQTRLLAKECPCGRPFPLVSEIVGRTEDCVLTPEGFIVGRLDHLFKGAVGVHEAQVVQRDPGSLVLRIVKNDLYTSASERAVREETRRRVGTSMRVLFEYPDRIERNRNGKFRFVINECRGLLPPEIQGDRNADRSGSANLAEAG